MTAISWKNAVSGSWATAADWSTGTVPGSSNAVTIGVAGTYTISLTATSQSAASLAINGVGAGLAIAASGSTGSTLVVGGTLSNAGTIELTGSSAAATLNITGAVTNNGSISLTGNATLTGGAFTNNGIVGVGDGWGDAGGGSATLGLLTNSGDFDIGNTSLASALTVTASGFSNAASGTIHLVGGSAQAELNITATAPGLWTGFAFLDGNTLLHFAGGGITQIAADSTIALDGAQARVGAGSALGNSALTGLATNAGNLTLEGGAILSTTGSLSNSGSLWIDGGSPSASQASMGSRLVLGGALNNTGGVMVDRGSQLFVGGTLTNAGDLTIGDSNLSQTTTVTAAGFAGTGSLWVTGYSARATLNVTGTAPTTVTSDWNLTGNALVEFGSGGLTGIARGGQLVLDGPRAHVALSGNTNQNTALVSLTSNAGFFSLFDGVLVRPTGSFSNSGSTDVDAFSSFTYNGAGAGGSTLAVGGTLINSGFLDIGNSGIVAATTVSAAQLVNTGSIDLSGGMAQAKLSVMAAAPTTLSGYYTLTGNAALIYAGGTIGGISQSSSLVLNGAQALVERSLVLGSNSALTTLSSNAGTFKLADGVSVSTNAGVNFTNTGSLGVDDYSGNYGGLADMGGSSLTIGGTLTNSNTLDIGNSGMSVATTVTAAALVNATTIDLTGGTAQATLAVAAAAPATLSGNYFLSGDASLQYGSGAITAIGSFASLSLNGAAARVALSATPGSNSALTKLSSNFGSFQLSDGASVATTVGFANHGTLSVDYSGAGGSSLAIGGTLTNSNFDLQIGNSGISTATTVTAAQLANTGGIHLIGGTAQATLAVGAVAPTTLTGGFYLNGNALLRYASGAITAIGSGANLSLDGAKARVAVSATPGSNSALTTLGSNAGELFLADGAVVATTAAFANTSYLELDSSYSDGGGSSFTVGGTLTNSSVIYIGNTGISAATTVNAAALVNTDYIDLTGGLAHATLNVTGNASNGGFGSIYIDTASAGGGGVFTVGGTLSNSSTLDIGNTNLIQATTVTAGQLVNTGNIYLSGGTAQAKLTVGAGSSDSGSMSVGSGGVLALGGTLTVTGSLGFAGGTISGGTLAGAGSISDNSGTGTLSGVTVAAGTTVGVTGGSLVLTGVTVNGTIEGGLFSSSSALTFAQHGTDAMTGISGFATINLTNGGANGLFLTSANFANVGGGVITVNDGNSGNTVNAGTLPSADAIIVNAGTGADKLIGGAGNDVFYAANNTAMTGGVGTNQFTFAEIGTNTIADFHLSASNELVFRNSGFNLGVDQGLGTSSLQHLDSSVFVANATGAFGNTSERFAYNTSTGVLSYSANGNGGDPISTVATLTDTAALSAGAAGNLYFTA